MSIESRIERARADLVVAAELADIVARDGEGVKEFASQLDDVVCRLRGAILVVDTWIDPADTARLSDDLRWCLPGGQTVGLTDQTLRKHPRFRKLAGAIADCGEFAHDAMQGEVNSDGLLNCAAIFLRFAAAVPVWGQLAQDDRELLQQLLEGKHFSQTRAISREKLGVATFGPDSAGLGKAITALNRLKPYWLVSTADGRSGGNWLNEYGKSFAEENLVGTASV